MVERQGTSNILTVVATCLPSASKSCLCQFITRRVSAETFAIKVAPREVPSGLGADALIERWELCNISVPHRYICADTDGQDVLVPQMLPIQMVADVPRTKRLPIPMFTDVLVHKCLPMQMFTDVCGSPMLTDVLVTDV